MTPATLSGPAAKFAGDKRDPTFLTRARGRPVLITRSAQGALNAGTARSACISAASEPLQGWPGGDGAAGGTPGQDLGRPPADRRPGIRVFPNAGAVRRPLGVSDELVGEEGEAVTDGLGIDEAHWFLVAGLAEEAFAGPEHDRVDDQPQLVGEVVLDQRALELIAGVDDDVPV